MTAIASLGGVDRMGSVELGEVAAGSTHDAGSITLETSSASCEPSWLPTFDGDGALPGGGGSSIAVFDSGDGPKLHVGGLRLLRWDGAWTELGIVNVDWKHGITEMLVHDDGTGPALYIAGRFHTINGIYSPGVARWDGSKWSAMGVADSSAHPVVHCLAVYDSGSGPELHAGVGNSHTTMAVVRWNGSSWVGLGSAIVYSMAVFDSGSGPFLYAGGTFSSLSGAGPNLARWNGTSWSSVGGGTDSWIEALQVFDDGSGPALYVAGEFTSAGGQPHQRIAKWTGSAWGAPLGDGMNGTVRMLEVFDDGTGPVLVAGGNFTTAGGAPANRLAQWDGAGWSPVGNGIGAGLLGLGVFEVGGAPKLVVTGALPWIGALYVGGIALWDGASWSPMGRALDGEVLSLAVFDGGDGPLLHAGGGFQKTGNDPLRRLGRWDGTAWSSLGSGANGAVRALVAHDDGHGPSLFAGGDFTEAGDVPAARVARWDGTQWHAFGRIEGGESPRLEAFAVFDDGTGPALYATGAFASAGGVPANRIARWDGSSWSALGTGLNGDAYSLTAGQLAGAPALLVGGAFGNAGGIGAATVARWNGSSWSNLGSGLTHAVRALALIDFGAGTELYAGGTFPLSPWAPGHHIARWNGTSWGPVGGGVAPLPQGQSQAVRVLLAVEEGAGRFLLAGGSFPKMLDTKDAYLARWGCTLPAPGTAYCFGGDAGACPCGNGVPAEAGCANSTGAGVKLTGSGSASVIEDDLLLHVMGMPPFQPALLFAGTNAVNGGAGLPFGDGLRCAGGGVERLGVKLGDPGGAVTFGPSLAAAGGFVAGDVTRFQVWYRDPVGSPCGSGFNLSNGYEVPFE